MVHSLIANQPNAENKSFPKVVDRLLVAFTIKVAFENAAPSRKKLSQGDEPLPNYFQIPGTVSGSVVL